MRDFSKNVVKSFDNAVKEKIDQNKLDTFLEVANQINDLVGQKNIFKQKAIADK